MKTKTLFLFIIFIISLSKSIAQKKDKIEIEIENYKPSIFPDAFIVGTFSDYNGRFQYIDKQTQIDRYYPKEKSLGKYVSYFIEKYYKIDNELFFKENDHSELYIPNLSNRLNTEYYSEYGQLNIEKLKTEEEKLSFLLGVFYRYGQHLDDSIYEIKLSNSDKEKAIYILLKDLGCDKIVYKSNIDKIPNSYSFYFVATPKMIKYFETLKEEKAQLNFDSISFITDDNKNFDDFNRKKAKQKKELIKNLELIFK